MRISPDTADEGGLEAKNREDLLQTTRRLLADLQALSSRISVIQEITLVINRKLSLDDILREVGRRAKWLLDFNYCGVSLCQSDGTRRNSSLFTSADDQSAGETLSSTLVEQSIEKKQPQIIANNPTSDQFPYPSQLIIPLENEGDVLGAIIFAARQTKAYSLDDLRVGMLLSMQLAIAIRNARRFAEINRLYTELEQTYTDLRRAESLREDLTNMVVHDLRNPLTVISGNLEFLAMSVQTNQTQERQEEYLLAGRGAIKRMVVMLDNLLSISKLDAGELKPVLAPLDLAWLLAEKESTYRAQGEQELKRVVVCNRQQWPSVIADEGLISRVIDNLVSNAFKFIEPDKGCIEIGIEEIDGFLRTYIRDNGIGIPPEYHEMIFDRFKQVTNEKGVPVGQGTGLGLAFCRLAVEAHGGKIWVESVPAQGSSFYFTLPLDSSGET